MYVNEYVWAFGREMIMNRMFVPTYLCFVLFCFVMCAWTCRCVCTYTPVAAMAFRVIYPEVEVVAMVNMTANAILRVKVTIDMRANMNVILCVCEWKG